MRQYIAQSNCGSDLSYRYTCFSYYEMREVFRKLKFWLNIVGIYLNFLGNRIKYGIAIKEELKANPQPKLTSAQKREIKDYFAQYGFNSIKTHWHCFYGGYSNQYSKKYIPQDFFFSHLEVALNNEHYIALQDKNLLQSVFKDIQQPKTVVSKINGMFLMDNQIVSKNEAMDTCLKSGMIIVKPTVETYGGLGVAKLDLSTGDSDNRYTELTKLFDSYRKDFIVQEIVDQSDEMKALNETSLNTIRISTYLRNDEVVVLFSVVRFGAKGVYVDNISQGGFYCIINDDGSLHDRAFNTFKKTITKTDAGAVLKDFSIPNYNRVKEMVQVTHRRVPYFKMISWDVALDSNNFPVLIEFNAFGQSIDFQSVCGPLFGDYTDEVLAIAKDFKEKRLRYSSASRY